ncbi:EAL domain-containing protein [Pleionea sediminis]|uniref:EAL domain-containing protein n=1 Tax=Pleionea sediminis TaxID=2569479 RepID=UPI0011868117|nr:EAL domain-containing protein [Pleionea sediminis]
MQFRRLALLASMDLYLDYTYLMAVHPQNSKISILSMPNNRDYQTQQLFLTRVPETIYVLSSLSKHGKSPISILNTTLAKRCKCLFVFLKVFIFCTLSVASEDQSSLNDSMLEIPSATSTEQVTFLSPQEKEQQAIELEKNARETDDLFKLAQAHYLRGRIALYRMDSDEFETRVSHLKEIYENTTAPRISLLIDLLKIEQLFFDDDYTAAMNASKKIENELSLVEINLNSAQSIPLKPNGYQSISSQDIALASGIIGRVYTDLGQYERALNLLLYGLTIYQRLNNREEVIRLRTYLAKIYSVQRELHTELKITKENLKELENSTDSVLYFLNQQILAGRLAEGNSLEASLKIYQSLMSHKALSYYPKNKGNLYLNSTLVHLRAGEFEKAFKTSAKAIELMKSYGDEDNLNYTIAIQGNILRKQNKPKEAIPLFIKALEYFKRNNMDYEASQIINQIQQSYAMIGDHKNAYKYLTEQYYLTRELFNEDRAKAIESLQAKYDIIAKENAIKELKSKNQLEQERTRLTRDRYLFFLIVSISLSLIIVLLILRKNAKHEANRLREHNQQIAAREHQLLLLATAFENTSDAVFITDNEFKIQEVNSKFYSCTQKSKDSVIEKPYYFSDTKGEDKNLTERLMSLARENEVWKGESYDQRSDGEIYPIKLEIRAIKNDQQDLEHYLVFFRDLSLDKRNQETLKQLETHDSLTSLPNRSLFIELLDNACAYASRFELGIAVLHINLDGFKKINDSFDHSVGDHVLKYFSEKLLNLTENKEVICRAGSDEFIMYIHSKQPDIEAQNMLSRINELLDNAFEVNNQSFKLTCCIGVSLFPQDGSNAGELIKKSGLALSEAKAQGKNSYRFFEAHMNSHMTTRFKTEQAIIHAVDDNKFIFHFQPLVNFKDKSICGAEALIRWPKTAKDYLPPNQFIPVAESSGLIERIDKLVIENIFQQIAQWNEEVPNQLIFSINISARMFINTELLLETLSFYKKKYQLPSKQVKVEVTETDLLKHLDKAISTMSKIKEEGYHLALDDFGTGYSSLNYLKQLPIDTLKIDRSFVKDIHLSEKNKNIVRCIIELAHSLDLQVTAEGIELEEQFEILKEFHCDNFQGYLFSPAIEADAFFALIKNNNLI